MSPSDTPSQFGASSFASPEPGRLTEPRNYAPRTAGLPITYAPPPKFNLELPTQHNSQDPFAPVQAGNALVAYQPGPQALIIQSQRSNMLNMLTETQSGLPSYTIATSLNNFPFTYVGSMHCPNPRIGVVKLKNVSNLLSDLFGF